MNDMQHSGVSAEEIAEIDAMLANLDMPLEASEEAAAVAAEPADLIEIPITLEQEREIAETVAEIEAAQAEEGDDEAPAIEDIEATVAQLERQAAIQEAYAEQASVEEQPEIKPADPTVEKPKIAKAKAASPKTPKAPKAPRPALADLPVEAFVLDIHTSDEPTALVANKTAVMGRRPAQVKVAEKFDNILQAIAAGRLPSTYTVDCYRVLKASGRTTSAALAAALNATSKKQDVSATYSIGTARSQAGQFMALAPALKIALREGKELVLNPDSTIAMALDALLAS